MKLRKFHSIAVAMVVFSMCGAGCKGTTPKSETVSQKEVTISRYALCIDHDIFLWAGGNPTGKTPQEELDWSANKVRQYAQNAGMNIGEGKAKQLLLQARADYDNRTFGTDDCKQYVEDFEVFQKEASGAANGATHQ